jgi:hypothetical protein
VARDSREQHEEHRELVPAGRDPGHGLDAAGQDREQAAADDAGEAPERRRRDAVDEEARRGVCREEKAVEDPGPCMAAAELQQDPRRRPERRPERVVILADRILPGPAVGRVVDADDPARVPDDDVVVELEVQPDHPGVRRERDRDDDQAAGKGSHVATCLRVTRGVAHTWLPRRDGDSILAPGTGY